MSFDDDQNNTNKSLDPTQSADGAEEKLTKCETEGCENTFPQPATGRRKYCEACVKDRHREIAINSFHKMKDIKKAKQQEKEDRAESYKSQKLLSDDDIRSILIDRGLENKHVIETVLDLGRMAAEINKFVPNRFYWLNGFTKMSEALETGEPSLLDPVSNEQANQW